MKKKEYQKPSMQVVLLQHETYLLAGSNGANSLNSTDGFILYDDLDDDDV